MKNAIVCLCLCAFFNIESGVLSISDLRIGDKAYAVEMELQHDGDMRLISAEEVPIFDEPPNVFRQISDCLADPDCVFQAE